MSKSRILLLAAASFAFLLMLSSVTASSEFQYAPESTWRTTSDAAQDIAVAAWHTQTARSAVTRASTPSASTDDVPASSAQAASSAQPTSSAPPESSAPAQVSSSPSSVGDGGNGDLPDWAEEWWKRFGGDEKRKGRKGRD